MKLLTKTIIIGFISFIIAFYGNVFIGIDVGKLLPGGDELINSYLHPIYFGIAVLIALVISCTYLIVSKINNLLTN